MHSLFVVAVGAADSYEPAEQVVAVVHSEAFSVVEYDPLVQAAHSLFVVAVGAAETYDPAEQVVKTEHSLSVVSVDAFDSYRRYDGRECRLYVRCRNHDEVQLFEMCSRYHH